MLLIEGMANYLAMQLLEKTHGPEQLRRYQRQALWASYEVPRTRAAVPLLRADTGFLGYRKGAHALYGLSRYIGEERMNTALRRLFEKYQSGAPPLPTTRDLFAELRAVTPPTYQYLLRDLFEANTFWELETQRAAARHAEGGAWQVTLDVKARKLVVDEAGVETDLPLDDWIDIGVFAPAEHGDALSTPLYVQKHHVNATTTTIMLTVPGKPSRAGTRDPYNLLIDWDTDDNVTPLEMQE